MIKFLSLFTSNIILFFILLFFLDLVGVTNIYTNIKDTFKSDKITENKIIPTNSLEKEIMYKQQFNMAMNSILIKEKEIKKNQLELKEIKSKLDKEKKDLSQREKNLINKINRLKQEEKENQSYENKVNQLAQNYYNMPPQNAMESLLSLKDDLLIIDTLNAMDKYAGTLGVASSVPFILSIMPPEESGRILKTMAIE